MPKITNKIEDLHVCMDSEQRTHKADDPDKERINNISASAKKAIMEFDPAIDTGILPNRIASHQEQDRMHMRHPSRKLQKDMAIAEDDRELLKEKGRYRPPEPHEKDRWYQPPLEYDPYEAEIRRDPGKRVISGEDQADFLLRHTYDVEKMIAEHADELPERK